MIHDIPLIIAAGLYLAAAVFLYRSIRFESSQQRTVALVLAVAGAVAHGAAQFDHWFGQGQIDVSIASLISLCALAVIIILVLSPLTLRSLFEAGLVALPISAAVCVLEWVLPDSQISMNQLSPGIAVHLVSSVLAFGLLSIAGVYAMFVHFIDYFLRNHNLSPMVRTMPALEILDDLLFRLIIVGFLMLTISLGTGLTFISDIFAQHLVHKTVLSFLTWIIFGVLLFGRWRYGWRGGFAVRLTLAGIILLALSYFGTKLVLEVILDRNWQS